MATVLVTGATGTIGRALCAHLHGAATVVALARRPAEGPWDRMVCGDLAREEPPADAMAGVDTVYHLAARTHALDERGGDDGSYARENVEGTRRVLEAARRAGVRALVFTSSVKAMGETADGDDESAPPSPSTAYGRTKLQAEELVLGGGHVPHPVVLRLPVVYGPGAAGNVTRLVDAVRRGRFPAVPRVHNRRSMVHADDVATAAVRAAGEGAAAGRVFIVTDGVRYSAYDIVASARRACGRPEPNVRWPLVAFHTLARVGDAIGAARGRRWRFDSDAFAKLFGTAWYDDSAIRAELGFRPAWDFPRALPDIVRSLEGSRE